MPGHHSIQALTRLFLADGLAGLGLLLSGCLEGGSSSGDLDLSRAPEVEGSRVAVIHGFGRPCLLCRSALPTCTHFRQALPGH